MTIVTGRVIVYISKQTIKASDVKAIVAGCVLAWHIIIVTQDEDALLGGLPLFFFGGASAPDVSPSPSVTGWGVGFFFGGRPRFLLGGGSSSVTSGLGWRG